MARVHLRPVTSADAIHDRIIHRTQKREHAQAQGANTEPQARKRWVGIERLPSIDFAQLIFPDASNAQNNVAAVSADGSTVWVLIRRLRISTGVRVDFQRRDPERVEVRVPSLPVGEVPVRVPARRSITRAATARSRM
jgi:hypothetical protein